MLGQRQQEHKSKIYLSIAKGNVERQLPNGEKELYSYVEGGLVQLLSKERTFGGEVVKYYYLDIRDGEELYSLGFPLHSGTLRSIILNLASDTELRKGTPIRIEPYFNKYTKVKVYSNGVQLDWITQELPAVETITVGNKTVKDGSKRDQFICSLIETIQRRIM